ncbi:uncharacterized protein VNE69_03332 [Vairimorpha necatrix]|uniref:Uncharacterized protein n=1 Tax=Vairimorpha necatrix TaxID=6039 RepID=A0AAX4JB63_9MICR
MIKSNLTPERSLLFDRFNTSTSFVDGICYIHLQGEVCKCQKRSLGNVKTLAKFFESIKLKKPKTNEAIAVPTSNDQKSYQIEQCFKCEGIKVCVSEKIRYFEEIQFNHFFGSNRI